MGLGLQPTDTVSILSRRTSMFMLGLSILLFCSRNLPHSSARQYVCLSTGITLLGLACMGSYELIMGTVNSSMLNAIIIEITLGTSFLIVFLRNRKAKIIQKMKIKKVEFPKNSLLYPGHEKYDYVDSYEGVINDKDNKICVIDIGKAFFKPAPKWIDGLVMIRNKIVSIFGLKIANNTNDCKQLDSFKCEPGEQMGLFKVFSKTEDEVIMGEDDKHLDFRVSLFLDTHKSDPSKKVITVTTTVKFNNWFGRLYFLPVKPFHKLIVPIILRINLQELESEMNS